MAEGQLALRTNERWLPEKKDQREPTTNAVLGTIISAIVFDGCLKKKKFNVIASHLSDLL